MFHDWNITPLNARILIAYIPNEVRDKFRELYYAPSRLVPTICNIFKEGEGSRTKGRCSN